ncbi:MAG: sulfatase-like hydrolase/transferase [Armatimonadetes bacterium]|nr:sulfatase-like hydrolase/transferase [Armatimonadota bacterium]
MSTPPPRPNFLVFVTDQQPGCMLGCDGHPVLRTPHLDRLAAEGVRLSRCYTVHPMCMTTRATLFTGRTPRGHGVRCNGIPLDPVIPTVAAALRRAGYATHGIGKHHFRNWMPQRGTDPAALDPAEWCEAGPLWRDGRIRAIPTPYYGLETVEILIHNGHTAVGDWVPWAAEREPRFREIMSPPKDAPNEGGRVVWPNTLPAELHYDQWMTERAVAALRHYAAAEQPFFLWHSFPDPHPPYTAPAPWGTLYNPADAPPPNRRDGELDDLAPHFRMLRHERFLTSGCAAPCDFSDEHVARQRSMTYGMVSHVDYHVGQVLAELERLDLARNTVVVFTSDHGRLLGDHWLDNMPPAHFDEVLRIPGLWRFAGRFAAGRVCDGLASHLDFAPTILDLAGVEIPEGAVPATPECERQRAAWPGHSLRPLLEGAADAVQESVVGELDEDYLGLQLRTLITRDHWLTVYGGDRSIGELFDQREDPRQLHNRWADPAFRAVRRELEAELMYRLIEQDGALPRRLCHA